MEILLASQLTEQLALSSTTGADAAEEARALFNLATNALMAAGAVLKQQKEKLGRGFKKWVEENEFAGADSTKLIKLFDSFGANANDLTEVNPLSLFRLLSPNSAESKEQLLHTISEYKETGDKVKDSDIAAVKKAHDVKKPKRESGAKMIGNQVGGTGVLRLEVKEHELANDLDNAFQESGFTSAGKWLDFLNESARTIQEISELVLGHRIENKEEMFDLVGVVTSVAGSNPKESEFVPLAEALPRILDCAGLKVMVPDNLQSISPLLRDEYEKLRNKTGEILYQAKFEKNRFVVDFGFARESIPQDWLLVVA